MHLLDIAVIYIVLSTPYRYTGQTELSVEVPDTDANFAIGAFVIHPEEGLAIIDRPQQVSGNV